MRRSAAQFAADAAKRHPMNINLPVAGDAVGRAEVSYFLNVINLLNLGNATWEDVEVWVNRTHVVHVPTVQPGVLKTLHLRMFYDDQGRNFSTDSFKNPVRRVERVRDGKIHNVPIRLPE